MGYALSTLDISDVVRSIWESGNPFIINRLNVRGDTTPVFKVTVDLTNINVIVYHLSFIHTGNNYDAKITLDSTDEYSDNIGGNQNAQGRIDTSGYTGSTEIKITLDGVANSGYITTGSFLMAVET